MPAAVISIQEGGSISGLSVAQDANGFFVGAAIYQQGSGAWALGRSNELATLATDVVAEIIDPDNFRRAFDGEEIEGVFTETNFTPGQPLGESSTAAGELVQFDSASGSAPNAVASNVLGYATGDNSMIFRKERAIG